MRLIVALGAALGLAAVFAPDTAWAQPPDSRPTPRRTFSKEQRALVRGLNHFAFDLLERLPDDGRNAVFSPLSVATALSMTAAGARQPTAGQIASVLHVESLGERVPRAFEELLADVRREAGRGDRLEVANALWGQSRIEFRPQFRETLGTAFGADLFAVDFADRTGTATAINDWVARKTHGMIRDVVTPESLGANEALVLTDAIYFKGSWAVPFPRDRTENGPFHLGGGPTVEVPFMRQKGQFRYAEDPMLRILELPYAGGSVVLDVFLPVDPHGLPAAEHDLIRGGLDHRLSSLKTRTVDVSLPRLRFARETELRPALAALGMGGVFERGDFSGMASNARGLVVSGLIHKAVVEVNEEGTEAAAVSKPTFTITNVPEGPPPVFRADHPFVMVIRDRASGCLFFVGRVAAP